MKDTPRFRVHFSGGQVSEYPSANVAEEVIEDQLCMTNYNKYPQKVEYLDPHGNVIRECTLEWSCVIK